MSPTKSYSQYSIRNSTNFSSLPTTPQKISVHARLRVLRTRGQPTIKQQRIRGTKLHEQILQRQRRETAEQIPEIKRVYEATFPPDREDHHLDFHDDHHHEHTAHDCHLLHQGNVVVVDDDRLHDQPRTNGAIHARDTEFTGKWHERRKRKLAGRGDSVAGGNELLRGERAKFQHQRDLRANGQG